jgi:excisionase family DNA binding protein
MSQLMTVGRAAERLAVSKSMVRKLIKQRRLTRVRIGRCVRVRAEEVDAFVAAGAGAA